MCNETCSKGDLHQLECNFFSSGKDNKDNNENNVINNNNISSTNANLNELTRRLNEGKTPRLRGAFQRLRLLGEQPSTEAGRGGGGNGEGEEMRQVSEQQQLSPEESLELGQLE
jgi:hypothetical protein